MGNTTACNIKSKEVFEQILINPRTANLNFKMPDTHPGDFAFRIIMTGDASINGVKLSKISISIPPDAMENRGLEGEDTVIPEIIETMPIDLDDNFLHDELNRFISIDELFDYLEEVISKK
jgi:hypothetical protein